MARCPNALWLAMSTRIATRSSAIGRVEWRRSSPAARGTAGGTPRPPPAGSPGFCALALRSALANLGRSRASSHDRASSGPGKGQRRCRPPVPGSPGRSRAPSLQGHVRPSASLLRLRVGLRHVPGAGGGGSAGTGRCHRRRRHNAAVRARDRGALAWEMEWELFVGVVPVARRDEVLATHGEHGPAVPRGAKEPAPLELPTFASRSRRRSSSLLTAARRRDKPPVVHRPSHGAPIAIGPRCSPRTSYIAASVSSNQAPTVSTTAAR